LERGWWVVDQGEGKAVKLFIFMSIDQGMEGNSIHTPFQNRTIEIQLNDLSFSLINELQVKLQTLVNRNHFHPPEQVFHRTKQSNYLIDSPI
jgi:hypothetical protein